jgi:5-methylcytosine-specific restriction endonuclease McrA
MYDTALIFDGCTGTMRSGKRRTRLFSERDSILETVSHYESSVANGSAHDFATPLSSSDVKADMMWMYDEKIVSQRSLDNLYDTLRDGAGGDCPYCGLDSPASIDHCLPKALYPQLSVTPLNLVPACYNCNTPKNAKVGGSLNPYFDTWATTDNWLEARIDDPNRPACVRFQVKSMAQWTPGQQLAAVRSFKNLGLEQRYADRVTAQWLAMGNRYKTLFATEGRQALLQQFDSNAVSYALNTPNGWKAAIYTEWARLIDEIPW